MFSLSWFGSKKKTEDIRSNLTLTLVSAERFLGMASYKDTALFVLNCNSVNEVREMVKKVRFEECEIEFELDILTDRNYASSVVLTGERAALLRSASYLINNHDAVGHVGETQARFFLKQYQYS